MLLSTCVARLRRKVLIGYPGAAKDLVCQLQGQLSDMKVSQTILEVKYVTATSLNMGCYVYVAVRER